MGWFESGVVDVDGGVDSGGAGVVAAVVCRVVEGDSGGQGEEFQVHGSVRIEAMGGDEGVGRNGKRCRSVQRLEILLNGPICRRGRYRDAMNKGQLR